MRRLKMVVYFLILGILSSLLGNVSFAWASTQDKLTITEIYDLDLVSAPLMCPVGSDSFDEIMEGVTLSSVFFEEDGYLYVKLTNENITSNILYNLSESLRLWHLYPSWHEHPVQPLQLPAYHRLR